MAGFIRQNLDQQRLEITLSLSPISPVALHDHAHAPSTKLKNPSRRRGLSVIWPQHLARLRPQPQIRCAAASHCTWLAGVGTKRHKAAGRCIPERKFCVSECGLEKHTRRGTSNRTASSLDSGRNNKLNLFKSVVVHLEASILYYQLFMYSCMYRDRRVKITDCLPFNSVITATAKSRFFRNGVISANRNQHRSVRLAEWKWNSK